MSKIFHGKGAIYHLLRARKALTQIYTEIIPVRLSPNDIALSDNARLERCKLVRKGILVFSTVLGNIMTLITQR